MQTPPVPAAQIAVPKRVYVVNEGAAVALPDGTVLLPGTQLVKETHGVDQKWLEDQTRSGHVRLAYATDVTETGSLRPLGSVQGTPEVAAKAGGAGAEVQGIQTGRIKQASRWTLDPKALASKSLEELNLLVKEREPQLAPFKTPAEAIGQLSLDFGK